MSAQRDVPQSAQVPMPEWGPAPLVVQIELDPRSMRFLSVSGRPAALLGYEPEAWISEGFWADRLHPDDRERVISHCADQARAGKGHEIDYRMVDRARGDVWVHQVCEVSNGDADEEGVLLSGYIVDITERYAHRVDVAQIMDLREALLKVINSELCQPVNIVSGYARLLERHLSSQGDDVGSDYAVGMREGIEALAATVSRLRAAAHGEKMTVEAMLQELAPAGAQVYGARGFAESFDPDQTPNGPTIARD